MPEVSLRDPDELRAVLAPSLADEPFWRARVERWLAAETSQRMHLAVFHEPFLTLLLEGKKTIESRFSINRIPPYASVARDDLILLKRNAGPVVGLALAGDPGYYELDSAAWQIIRSRFAAAICAPDERFWAARARARYGTLIPIRAATLVTPFAVAKRDRRGWVTVETAPAQQATLEIALQS